MFYLARVPLETQVSDYRDHKKLIEAIKSEDTAALVDVILKNKDSNMRLIDEYLDFSENV